MKSPTFASDWPPKTLVIAAWAAIALIAFVTLSPIGLRPGTGEPNLERFVAYALLGMLLGTAYPRRPLLIAELVIGYAILLEVLQLATPDRHGQLADMFVKIVGGLVGVFFVMIISRVIQTLKKSGEQTSSMD